MKKLFFLLVVTFAFIACEGPIGPQGPQGYGTNWNVQKYVVSANHWQVRDDEGFINIFDVRDLTDYIYTDGKVTAYLVQYPGTKDEVQTPLPYTMHHQDNTGYWTETYSFDYAPGSIAFYVTYSDFPQGTRPGSATFRVVMNW